MHYRICISEKSWLKVEGFEIETGIFPQCIENALIA